MILALEVSSSIFLFGCSIEAVGGTIVFLDPMCPADLAGVALPAAFLRWSIPPEEPVLATQLLALFVGGVALADRNLRHAGHVPNFELSVSLGLRVRLVRFNFFVSVRIIKSLIIIADSVASSEMCSVRFGFIFSYALMLSNRGPIVSLLNAFVAAVAAAFSVTVMVHFNFQMHLVEGVGPT